jgi:hypothetical protein
LLRYPLTAALALEAAEEKTPVLGAAVGAEAGVTEPGVCET